MNSAVKIFRTNLNKLNDIDYVFNVIAYNIAPTLKRLKAATTVTLCKHDRNILEHWKKHKHSITEKLNISAFELKETDRAIIVLFYDKELLEEKIKEVSNSNFLINFGYKPQGHIEENLKILGDRFEKFVCPHELGIFLGFPLEDVKEFIENPHKECLLCGYWKVYYNKDKALKTFKHYDEAKFEIVNQLCKNIDLVKTIAS
ncbi:DUF3793 family protein [Clostridium sp.]|uniref:DUF3793 family protein n=1 Tax=Clostridium sp. TaxID=1506 RepID=UPI002FCAA6B7